MEKPGFVYSNTTPDEPAQPIGCPFTRYYFVVAGTKMLNGNGLYFSSTF
jgi:hypothetical protein